MARIRKENIKTPFFHIMVQGIIVYLQKKMCFKIGKLWDN